MHLMTDGSFWGMHIFWWVFWFLIIGLFLSPLTPLPRGKLPETPLQILQRRYAANELSTPEYDERKQRLERESA